MEPCGGSAPGSNPGGGILKWVKMLIETGPIRPPSEGESLLLRVTRNCPWNKCKFCYGSPYARRKFEIRSIEEVKREIDLIKSELGNKVKAVFLQDADSLIMPSHKLLEILRYLRQALPNVERITSYARVKSIFLKSEEELAELRKAGLSRLHVGMESGDDEVLRYMDKGITSGEIVSACKKVKEAGIELSLYVMPGLGGKKWSKNHAKNSARVLNEIQPDFIRLRPLVPRVGTPLYKEWREGRFELLSPHEILKELKIMVNNLNANTRLCFDHMRNPSYLKNGFYIPLFSPDYNGYKLPEEKSKVLKLIEEGLKIEESLYMSVEEIIEIEKEFYRV